MKALSRAVVALAAGVLCGQCVVLAETFTEGVRVSPETVTLKPGEYVWEPERAPEGAALDRGQHY
jgi:hypothetical protein